MRRKYLESIDLEYVNELTKLRCGGDELDLDSTFNILHQHESAYNEIDLKSVVIKLEIELNDMVLSCYRGIIGRI